MLDCLLRAQRSAATEIDQFLDARSPDCDEAEFRGDEEGVGADQSQHGYEPGESHRRRATGLASGARGNRTIEQ